jgi:hypothetical protein
MAAHAALVVSFSGGFPATGSAHRNGQILASGKQSGFYCRNPSCHGANPAPTVTFRGPAAMEPGSSAIFSFTVTAHEETHIAAGFNVAASDGMIGLADEQGTRRERGEVTHSTPKANDANAEAAFEFTWQAPASPGVYTLFGAGCSVNGNDARDGDAAARTTYEIAVGVATSTPTHTPPLPTPTPTATAVRTPGEETCVGDCGGQAGVTVDELITGVNMALGATPVTVCLAFDANRDLAVTIDEILQAVNNARNGCPV